VLERVLELELVRLLEQEQEQELLQLEQETV
jgi:hypothetical protein